MQLERITEEVSQRNSLLVIGNIYLFQNINPPIDIYFNT